MQDERTPVPESNWLREHATPQARDRAERDRYKAALELIARWKDAWDRDAGVRGRSPSQVAREALNGDTE